MAKRHIAISITSTQVQRPNTFATCTIVIAVICCKFGKVKIAAHKASMFNAIRNAFTFMGIVNIITRVKYSTQSNGTSYAKVFFTTFFIVLRILILGFIITRCIKLRFIVLVRIFFVTVCFTFINIITVFQSDIVADEFTFCTTAQGQFLTTTFFVVTSNFVTINVIVSIFVSDVVQINGSSSFFII